MIRLVVVLLGSLLFVGISAVLGTWNPGSPVSFLTPKMALVAQKCVSKEMFNFDTETTMEWGKMTKRQMVPSSRMYCGWGGSEKA